MITVKYRGRLGNQLFQYAVGRLLAEGLGYTLNAMPIKGFPNTFQQIKGIEYSKYIKHYKRNVDIEKVIESKPERHIVLQGYFQNKKYVLPYKDKIKKWYITEPTTTPKLSNEDYVVHIRLGDLAKNGWGEQHKSGESVTSLSTMSIDYYKSIMDMAQGKIYIVTDSPGHDMVKTLQKEYDCILYHKSPIEDFNLIKSANRIGVTFSTFSWWAAFLSNAEEIVYPEISFKNIDIYK